VKLSDNTWNKKRGETMKKAAKTYLDSLKKVDKKAIGELPKDNFYYIRDAK